MKRRSSGPFDGPIMLLLVASHGSCNGDPEEACPGAHEPLKVLEVNVVQRCLSPIMILDDACLVNTATNPSGVGTSACLVDARGQTYIAGHYGYTDDLRGADYEVFGLEVADAPFEHINGEVEDPESCKIGYELLDQARSSCDADPSCGDAARNAGYGWSDAYLAHMPTCTD